MSFMLAGGGWGDGGKRYLKTQEIFKRFPPFRTTLASVKRERQLFASFNVGTYAETKIKRATA